MNSAKNEYQLPSEVLAALRQRPIHRPKVNALENQLKIQPRLSESPSITSKSYKTLPGIPVNQDLADTQESAEVKSTVNRLAAMRATGGRLDRHRMTYSYTDLSSANTRQFDSSKSIRKSTDEASVRSGQTSSEL